MNLLLRHVYISSVLLLSLTARAEEINTAFGYTLGMTLDTVTVLSRHTDTYGNTLLEVPIMKEYEPQSVFVGPDKSGKHIAYIIGKSKLMTAAMCQSERAKKLGQYQKRYTGSGYYAMDDTDMVIQQKKLILLDCKPVNNQYQLVIEFQDESLL